MITQEELFIMSVLKKRQCRKHQTFMTNCTACGADAVEFFKRISDVIKDTPRTALELREIHKHLEWVKQITDEPRAEQMLDTSMEQLKKISNRMWVPYQETIER